MVLSRLQPKSESSPWLQGGEQAGRWGARKRQHQSGGRGSNLGNGGDGVDCGDGSGYSESDTQDRVSVRTIG